MKICSPGVIESYIEQFGWSYKSFLESTWKTGDTDEAEQYNIVIHMSLAHISFKIFPFKGIDIDWDLWPEALSKYMELQELIPVLSLNICDAGELTITTTALRHDFDYDKFCNVIEVLSQHSYEVREEIFRVMDMNGRSYFSVPSYLS